MNNHVMEESLTPSSLIDLWFLMAGRIAPQLCCRYPPPLQQAFRSAIREVSRQEGDLDLAVQYLRDIVIDAPPEWMIFQQAGQLLNIIEWRRKYHSEWFTVNTQGIRMKSGICAPYVAHAMALLEAGVDDDALGLAGKIIEKGKSGSDDVRIAHLIRAAIFICSGDIDVGEDEFMKMAKVNTVG
ncbi:MAG: hypothetical protein CVV33_06965 [Methanomicrobiales archaeon HGW-Methanomicrobiales-4]|nr:MAG: hypothetical protein CVV33_06965 [Methanomicrobiales archaeon HGW-Methanomicrobiales-4]